MSDGREFRFNDDSPVKLKVGDKIMLPGRFKKRTFWEWATRQPREREIQEFTIVSEFTNMGIMPDILP